MRRFLVLDDAVLSVVLKACSELRDFGEGRNLHGHIVQMGSLDIFVFTGLVDMYADCGDRHCWQGFRRLCVRMYAKCDRIEDANYLFESMNDKDVVSWNSIICDYSQNGYMYEALKLFNRMRLNCFLPDPVTVVVVLSASASLGDIRDMLKENVKPTEIAFTTILSACSDSGMITEGWRHFDKMCKSYDFVPNMRHYACMVDLLARYGNLEEALKFIVKMPIQPDCTIFGSFLHGCNLHSRFNLGDPTLS